jgi:hypothetical protein
MPRRRASLVYNSEEYSDAGVIEYIDAFGTDVFDASSILIKLSGFWLDPDLLPCCWPMDAMSWLMKLAAGSAAGWFVEEAFAVDAALPLMGARP